MQPCDWHLLPHLLGTKVYTLPLGFAVDLTFPYPCSPGVVGSADTGTPCPAPLPDC